MTLYCTITVNISFFVYAFSTFKLICDSNEGINIRQLEDSLEKLKSKFQERLVDFEKIENVVHLVNNSISLMPNSEWTSEVTGVFESNNS